MKKSITGTVGRLFVLIFALVLLGGMMPGSAGASVNGSGFVLEEDITDSFKDANFLAFVRSRINKPEGPIFNYDVDQITTLNVRNLNISSLSGIEHFIALTTLTCSWNQLTELDISNSTALTELDCSWNQLSNLDFSNNTALTYLQCSFNQLTELDLLNNTALTMLLYTSNQLKELDLSNNTALTTLYCNGNYLTELDLSNNTALTVIDCSYNQLAELDLSNNTAVTEFYCQNNQLTELDISKSTALTRLDCYNNQLTELDLSNSTELTEFYCSSNQLTKLDLSKNIVLTGLNCSSNQLTELDISKSTALTGLNCSLNQLTELDISENTALTEFYCQDNQLTELDISKNTVLRQFYCNNNPIAYLRLSGNREMSISAEPGGSGTVMLIAFGFSSGSVSLQATVNGDGTFNGWTYAGFPSNPSESSNPVSFTLPDNPVAITANFETVISGTVEIAGTAKFGQTLTANVADSNATAFAYQWKRGVVDIDGANTASYTLEEADIGEIITVAVTSPGFTGELISAPTDVVTKADGPVAPAAPTMASRTATSITLNTIVGAEYRQGVSGMWQDSAEFIGLAPNTVYTFYARIAETSTRLASEASEASSGIATERSFLFGDFTGNGTVDANDILWIQRYIISGRNLSAMAQAFSPETIETFNELAADFTNTGYVDANDILWIRRYIVSNRDADVMIEEFNPSIDFSHLKG